MTNEMNISILAIHRGDDRFIPTLNRILPQLSPGVEPIDYDHWYEMTNESGPGGHQVIYVIKNLEICDYHDENFIGTATVVMIPLPTGWIAEIHDVIVDEPFQQKGFGRILTQHIFGYIQTMANKFRKVIRVSLTSRPERKLANAMYVNHGFELMAMAVAKTDPSTGEIKYEGTNLYRKVFTPQ